MIFITSFQLSELQKHLNAIQSIINCAHQQTVKSGNVVSSLPIRAMSKAELAALAGVSPRTFATWLHPHRKQLLGVCDF